jgi:hypothetical protein
MVTLKICYTKAILSQNITNGSKYLATKNDVLYKILGSTAVKTNFLVGYDSV